MSKLYKNKSFAKSAARIMQRLQSSPAFPSSPDVAAAAFATPSCSADAVSAVSISAECGSTAPAAEPGAAVECPTGHLEAKITPMDALDDCWLPSAKLWHRTTWSTSLQVTRHACAWLQQCSHRPPKVHNLLLLCMHHHEQTDPISTSVSLTAYSISVCWGLGDSMHLCHGTPKLGSGQEQQKKRDSQRDSG